MSKINRYPCYRTPYVQAFGRFLEKFPWSWYGTFTFEYRVSVDKAITSAIEMIMKYDETSIYFLCCEYSKSGVHLHALINGISDIDRLPFQEEWSWRYGLVKIEVFNRDLGGQNYIVKYLEAGKAEFKTNLTVEG